MEVYRQNKVMKWVGILRKHRDQGLSYKEGKGFSETSQKQDQTQ